MKVIFTVIIVTFLSSLNFINAQNVFPKKFNGCITDLFAMERDTTTAKINSIKFVQDLKTHLGEINCSKLRGTLKLQIIVDLNGNSCLLSLENITNISSKKLNLKSWIDDNIIWEIPSNKVAAIIILDFTDQGIGYKRMGFDGKKGWHYLNE